MNKKQFFLVMALSLVPFLFYVLFRNLPLGSDTFGFINNNCSQVIQHTDVVTGLVTPLSKTFFLSLSCNFFAIIFFEWLLFFLSILVLSKTGELFDKEFGWFYGLFLGLSMIGVTEFFKLEPLELGYPIMFLAFYFLLKYYWQKTFFIVPVNNKRNKYYFLALILFTGLVWKGSIFFFLTSVFFFPLLSLISLPATFVLKDQLIGGIIINNVQESRMFVGIIYSMFLLPFLWISFKQFNYKLKLFLGFLFLLLTASLKFSLFILPFSFLGISIALKHYRFGETLKYVLVAISVTSLFVFGFLTYNYPPTEKQLTGLEFAVQQADGNFIINDWSYGYWIHFLGGKTNYFAGGTQPDYNVFEGIIVTNSNTQVNGKLLFDNNAVKVWKK